MAVAGMAFVALFSAANCNAAAITGGSSMDTAVELKAGTYTGGAITGDTTQYFYVTLGQGQQVTAKAMLTSAIETGTISTIALYDQDRNQVVEEFDANYTSVTLTADWLVNGDQPTYKYYLKLASDDDGVTSYNLTLTITDRFDAGTTQDAPATFENALSVSAGTMKGYVTGDDEGGTDTADMFAFVPPADGAYIVTVTPPTDMEVELAIYDANRTEVDSQIGNNEGSIVTSTVQATSGAKVFIKVASYFYLGKTPAEYQFVIAAPAATNTNGSVTAVNQNAATSGNANTNSAEAVNQNLIAPLDTNTNTTAATANRNSNTAATTDDDEDEDSMMMYYIIGGAVLLLVIVIVLVMVMRKKKPGTPAQQPPANQ